MDIQETEEPKNAQRQRLHRERQTDKHLLNARQVAELLNVSEKHVRALEAEGKLPAVRIGAAVRWTPEAIREYIEAHTRQPAGAGAEGA